MTYTQDKKRPTSQKTAQKKSLKEKNIRKSIAPKLKVTADSGRLSILLLTAEGLGEVTLKELKLRKIQYKKHSLLNVKNHDGIVITVTPDQLHELYKLRTVEDIFLLILQDKDLYHISHLKALIPHDFKETILQSLKYIRNKKKKTGTNFYLFVKQDKDYGIYRKEVAGYLSHYITSHFRKWTYREPADIEIWGFYSRAKISFGLRLTTKIFRQRTYREEEMIGSLRPLFAAGLVLLSNPQSTDTFLDPMCGSGTILIERGDFSSALEITGCDINEDAIRLAEANIQNAKLKIPVNLVHKDSLKPDLIETLPSTFTKIVSNLPFGKKFSSQSDILSLYTKALKNWSQLLAPQGTITLLTPNLDQIKKASYKSKLRYRILASINLQGIKSYVIQLVK
jgi:tRNA (guanine6-N2)-methyltransferase